MKGGEGEAYRGPCVSMCSIYVCVCVCVCPCACCTVCVCVCVCVCVSISTHKQQQQHHVWVVTGTGHMERCPQVLILQVSIQPTLNQNLRRKHVVMASTLQQRREKQRDRERGRERERG